MNFEYIRTPDRGNSPYNYMAPAVYTEPEYMLNLRLKYHANVSAFGLTICSECGDVLKPAKMQAPHNEEQTVDIWTCKCKGCTHNRHVYLADCASCFTKPDGFENRMLIDSRFCLALAVNIIWGHWCACRVCGNYNDPGKRTSLVQSPDPVIVKVQELQMEQ